MATMACISRCMNWWALHLNGSLCLKAQTATELRPPLLCEEEQQASADCFSDFEKVLQAILSVLTCNIKSKLHWIDTFAEWIKSF